MEIPAEVPVMILPNAILFPQEMLPLYIFEPRYRRMLADALDSHRMFSVAMQKPGHVRESPAPVAGLGLIRASVARRDGTSHLVLQGITRVELARAVRYKPYRVHRIRPLPSTTGDPMIVDALLARVRVLAEGRLRQVPATPPFTAQPLSANEAAELDELTARVRERFLHHLRGLKDPGQVADLVSRDLLSDPQERQLILESTDVADRLRHLIHFLMAEIQRHRKE